MKQSQTYAALQKRHPELSPKDARPLTEIWDEVVDRIIQRMLELSETEIRELHINIKAEMSFELAKLLIIIADTVVAKRLNGRVANKIDLQEEYEECLGETGTQAIENTAQNWANGFWIKMYRDRWRPKTKAAIRKEEEPRKTKLSVKPVRDNHFIPRWFLKKYWAQGEQLRRHRKMADGTWDVNFVGSGGWAYQQNLYSDELEAYFQLIEGDAHRPIQMLLDTIPLYPPQQEALIGFFVVQLVRSPFCIDRLIEGVKRVVPERFDQRNVTSDQKRILLHQNLFRNNKVYTAIAAPLFSSEWALVKTDAPNFVLPDTSSVNVNIDGEFRIIVPLTPHICFATLLSKEKEKRAVPISINADDELTEKISALLASSAKEEFVSHPNFENYTSVAVTAETVLRMIALDVEKAKN